MMAGTSASPANLAARRRRSPAINSKWDPFRRIRMGWIIPFFSMELASSCRRPGSKVIRGWSGLGSICNMGTEATRVPGAGSSAGDGSTGTGFLGSSAERPLPKTLRCSGFLFIGQDLFCQLDVALRPTRAYVIENNRLTETGSFSQTDTARDHGLKDRIFEEVAKVLLHLASEIRTVVVHSE